jgi:hypothetical protein
MFCKEERMFDNSDKCFFLRVTEYVLNAANGVKRFGKIHWLCGFGDGVDDETWN